MLNTRAESAPVSSAASVSAGSGYSEIRQADPGTGGPSDDMMEVDSESGATSDRNEEPVPAISTRAEIVLAGAAKVGVDDLEILGLSSAEARRILTLLLIFRVLR